MHASVAALLHAHHVHEAEAKIKQETITIEAFKATLSHHLEGVTVCLKDKKKFVE